jgi:hypothetical protein
VGDPKDCRDNANRCIEIMNDSINVRRRETLLNLAKAWLQLARDLENSPEFSARCGDVSIIKKVS